MREKILKYLREKSGYRSGQSIADALNITRNAVHKHIKSLRTSGYTIESKQSSGYRLVDSLNHIDAKMLESELKGRLIGSNIIHLKSVDSTNREAYRLAENGCEEGTVVISETQTRGKGRMGRVWESSMPNNLYFSIVLRPKIPPSSAPLINITSALCVAETISGTGIESVKVKWPNDIMINGKKVCGILTEMKSESDIIEFLVVGIGINVNSMREDFPEELTDIVTTLKEELKAALSRQDFLKNVILNLEKWYYKALDRDEAGNVKEIWRDYSYLLNKTVTIDNINEKVTGTSLGIDDDGFLLLRDGDKTRKIFSGTITKVE